MTKDTPPHQPRPGQLVARWLRLDEAAARATQVAGRDVSINDILEMATAGHIRIAARIPEWERPGVGDLAWSYPDGTPAGAVATEGVARGIDPTRIDLLAMHGRVSLAGIRWQADDVNSDAGAITLTAGPGSPFIVADDLRILDTELRCVVAILNDEPCPPREQPAPACAGRQKLRVSAEERARAEIYNRWQELAEQICELRDSERDAGLAPTEREWAAQLRTRAEEALRELEGDPAFIAAMDAMIVLLEADRDLIFKGGESDYRARALMTLDARIEYWHAQLANIRIDDELAAECGASVAAEPARKDKEWAVCAREIADELHARDVAAGCHDSIVHMAERVATELRERGIHGPRGPLSGPTVKREALQGKKWMRKSTPSSMGKQGKTGNP